MNLHIFDLDGTITPRWEAQPFLRARLYLPLLALRGHNIAIATNQAGVAWRARTGQAKFPTRRDIGQRYLAVARAIPTLRKALWLTAVYDERLSFSWERWRGLAVGITLAAKPLVAYTSSNPAWHKPGAGMLLEAMSYYGVAPRDTIFYGDRESDRQAAMAAGVRFCQV